MATPTDEVMYDNAQVVAGMVYAIGEHQESIEGNRDVISKNCDHLVKLGKTQAEMREDIAEMKVVIMKCEAQSSENERRLKVQFKTTRFLIDKLASRVHSLKLKIKDRVKRSKFDRYKVMVRDHRAHLLILTELTTAQMEPIVAEEEEEDEEDEEDVF